MTNLNICGLNPCTPCSPHPADPSCRGYNSRAQSFCKYWEPSSGQLGIESTRVLALGEWDSPGAEDRDTTCLGEWSATSRFPRTLSLLSSVKLGTEAESPERLTTERPGRPLPHAPGPELSTVSSGPWDTPAQLNLTDAQFGGSGEE